MSRTSIIDADIVKFENLYSNKDIILKHSTDGFSLVFDSEVKFKYGVKHSEVELGDFIIKLGNDGQSLDIMKDEKKLFSLTSTQD